MDAAADIPEDVTDDSVSLAEAAHELNVTQKTIRAWIQDDAPCDRPGKPGRGNGALVNVSDLRRWRARKAGLDGDDSHRLLEQIGEALLDTLRRDAGGGYPAHVERSITADDAAVLYLAAYARIHRALTGKEPATLPSPIRQLFRIAETAPECAVSVQRKAWTK